jgi:ABC-type transporter Mla MlaB component
MTAYVLPEEVDFDDLVDLRTAGDQYIDATDEPVFDLGRLESSSSAVVAALVAWFRYAHGRGKVVKFVGVPKGIMNIIEVTELSEVLPVEEQA